MQRKIEDTKKMKLLYICDRTKCKQCNPSCKYTTDIHHAMYPFRKTRIFNPGTTYECWEEIDYSKILEVEYGEENKIYSP